MGIKDIDSSSKISDNLRIRDVKFIEKNLGILYSAPVGIFKRQKETH